MGVVDTEGKDREDISLSFIQFWLRRIKYIHNPRGLLAKRRSWIIPLPRKGVNMNIYVGNLSLEVTEEELRQEFVAFGEVVSVTIMNDKYIGSGQKRGYGFVEMPSQSEGTAAITALNGKILKNKTIHLVESLPLSADMGANLYSHKTDARFSRKTRQRRTL